MRRSLPGVNAELSAAFARLAALYFEIPERYRPDVTGERWQDLEAEVDRACGAKDRDAALRAIELWEDHVRTVLTCTLAHAPLEVSS